MLWIVLAGVLVIALVGVVLGLLWTRSTGSSSGSSGGGLPGAASTASPTISSWDEQDTPPPSTTPDPTPSDTSVTLVPCESVDYETVPQWGSTITAGGFSYPRPGGWDEWGFPTSNIVTESATLYRTVSGSSWMSTIEVGYVTGLESEESAAETVLQCYFTSESDHGYVSHDVVTSEEITIDGQTGWWLKVREVNEDVPGNYAILHAIVFDLGEAQGMRIFWTTAYEIDQKAIDDCELVRESLSLTP